ncbi:hypothetical protein [Sphingomonas sp. 8AM]|uniref:hypothetical protein n=1 Tax=Sphingomonas sp. 8AM TaxID=2653170 RepID=UPI0012EF64D7|nr:hypothetical protein [Sphingomonas sp. 8AM]VXC65709.1 conserved hypothetical protein [Sphingomonas sp. 8AM]
MARVILTIIALVLAITVIKAAIIALVVAGLIFRTQQTIGLLAIGGLATLVGAYPPIGLGLVAVLIIAAVARAVRN